jgi:hypothetical protein
MDAEAKNFEGLKEQKNKLFARLKLIWLSGKGINGALGSVKLMLFRAVLHQEAPAQELWLGPLFREILWMMLLARLPV